MDALQDLELLEAILAGFLAYSLMGWLETPFVFKTALVLKLNNLLF